MTIIKKLIKSVEARARDERTEAAAWRCPEPDLSVSEATQDKLTKSGLLDDWNAFAAQYRKQWTGSKELLAGSMQARIFADVE